MCMMHVEIWSDVVCPWCYIGKRRFEAALARFAHRDEVDVTWRSFELDPGAPAVRTGDPAQRLAEKYGMSREQALQANQRVTAQAAGEGLEYHLDATRSGNTFDAHRLLHLAAEHGMQGALKERLMRAYFTEGAAIGLPETLESLAQEVGIPPEDARRALASDAFAEAVRADEALAREFGIRGVPFFVLDRRYGVSGAQPADALLQGLEQAWADAHPAARLTPVGGPADDAACLDETCAI
jgi:predicted DsbA family dithiol-disulfide isomerase